MNNSTGKTSARIVLNFIHALKIKNLRLNFKRSKERPKRLNCLISVLKKVAVIYTSTTLFSFTRYSEKI